MSSHTSRALAPLSGLYGALTRARLALYRAGALRTHRISAPVISVGNITAGGTGKTPLVESLARLVAGEGRRVCILTRGYGREEARRRVVVSNGERLLATAREGGDEPRLLAENLLGTAAVVSDSDRVAAARWAQDNLRSEVFILDDGFQHLRLARDLDIVTVDATSPWGGGYLLPRGRLREPLEELRRADCIVITRAEMAADLAALRAELEQLSEGHADVIASRVRTLRACPLSGVETGRQSSDNDRPESEYDAVPQPVGAFCAIGNPQAFFQHLQTEGYKLIHTRAFPDHHAYTQSEVDAVAREAEQRGARALVTTAKDAVKLRAHAFQLPVYVVEIELEFEGEGETLLRRRVREVLSGKGA